MHYYYGAHLAAALTITLLHFWCNAPTQPDSQAVNKLIVPNPLRWPIGASDRSITSKGKHCRHNTLWQTVKDMLPLRDIYIWNCWYITTNYWRFTPLKGQLNKKCCYSNVIMSVETVVRPAASWAEWQCQSLCHAAVSEQMQVDHPGVRMLTSLPLSQTYHIHASPEHHVSIYQLSNIYLLHYYYTHLMASFPGQHG